jgi:pSer/pThr/pTyr-binding forkhead associated (FHA) protein
MEPTRKTLVYAGLEEVNSEGEPLFHAIVTDIFRIGRDPESNLVIKGDTKTSRRHATILRKGVIYTLHDNASSNGTQLNGQRITSPVELRVGDIITIGSRTYTFNRKVMS